MEASEEASVWRQVRFTDDAACPARSGHAALFCASQRSVLVLGGHNETALDDIWRFSLDEQRWHQVEVTQPNPLPRVMFTAAIIENDVYLFGGVHEDGVYNDLWKLDTLTGRWELLFEEAPASERCNHAMTATKDGQMVIHGGECLEKLSDGWIFDSQALSWEPLVPQRSKKQKQKDKKKGKPIAGAPAAQPSPGPRVGHTLAYIAQTDSLLLFGGLSTGLDGMVETMNDLWVMPMGAKPRVWSQVPLHGLAPSPRSRPAYVAITPNTLLILGGYGLKENENIVGEDDEEEAEESEEGEEEAGDEDNVEVEAQAEDAKKEEEEDVKEEEEKHEVEAPADEEEEEKHEAEEEEESQFEEIVEDFLNDAWLIKADDLQSVDLNFHAQRRFAYNGPARHGLSATLCGDTVLIFGGFDGKEYSDRIDVASVSELKQALRIEPNAKTKA